jgi:hypothetical protein
MMDDVRCLVLTDDKPTGTEHVSSPHGTTAGKKKEPGNPHDSVAQHHNDACGKRDHSFGIKAETSNPWVLASSGTSRALARRMREEFENRN